MSEDVVIRATEPADAPGIAALLGRPGTFEGTLQLPDMPVASRVASLQAVDPQACKLVAVAGGGEVVGMGALYTVASLRRAHVRSLAIAIAPERQGQGLGRQMMARLLDWADRWGQVLRIELHVHADNAAAITLYRSLGFVEEGRHRAYALKNGAYVDSLSMARLHPSPPKLPG
jgi:putative acetyltransferase